jgi:hypothetical protein
VPSYGGEEPRFRPWKCRTGTSSSLYSLVSLKSGVIMVQYLYLKFGCPVSETNQQCCSIHTADTCEMIGAICDDVAKVWYVAPASR